MKIPTKRSLAAFTLVEMLVSVACSSIILAAVVTAGVALQRSFAAVEAYSISEGDQLRVQDYIAMDCRRATTALVDAGAWTNSGGTWNWVSNPSGTAETLRLRTLAPALLSNTAPEERPRFRITNPGPVSCGRLEQTQLNAL